MLAPLDAQKPVKLRYAELMNELLDWLLFLHPPQSQNTFLLDAAETLAAAVPKQELQALLAQQQQSEESRDNEASPWSGIDWRDSGPVNDWLQPLDQSGDVLTSVELRRRWRIGRWLDERLPIIRFVDEHLSSFPTPRRSERSAHPPTPWTSSTASPAPKVLHA